MRFLGRLTQGEVRLTRIEAFSDGVFAIILTALFFIVPPCKPQRCPNLRCSGRATALAAERVRWAA